MSQHILEVGSKVMIRRRGDERALEATVAEILYDGETGEPAEVLFEIASVEANDND